MSSLAIKSSFERAVGYLMRKGRATFYLMPDGQVSLTPGMGFKVIATYTLDITLSEIMEDWYEARTSGDPSAAEVLRLRNAGKTLQEIAMATGVHYHRVQKICRGRLAEAA